MTSVPHQTIAYQGEPGANSHIACADAYPGWTPLPCATFEDAFAAVQDGTATLGMIPIENSIAGRVADIHALMPGAGLHIVGEYFLPIHFQLLGVKGTRIDQIRHVHSHIHALGQCRKIIRKLGAAAHVAGGHGGLGARGRRGGTIRPAPRLRRGSRARSTGSTPSPPMWRTRPTTRRASSSCRRLRPCRCPATARS